MTDPFFFGYGSLVNRRTHAYPEAHPARVTGWRRAWRKSPERARCFLTAIPAPDDYVDGLIAAVPGADWAALDLREAAYTRHDVSQVVAHPVGRPIEIAIYAIPEAERKVPTGEDAVVLSYIDVVVQGFLQEFGPDGVAHFFETTEGWDVSVINDRAAPVYARAQTLDPHETEMVDEGLSRLRTRIIAPR